MNDVILSRERREPRRMLTPKAVLGASILRGSGFARAPQDDVALVWVRKIIASTRDGLRAGDDALEQIGVQLAQR